MRLELIEYTCATCGIKFDAPGLPESAYGEFLLRSKRGTLRYLNALSDATYTEVDCLLAREHVLASAQNQLERSKVLRKVYGPIACDWDDGIFPFQIGMPPSCPRCHQSGISSWSFKSPPTAVDVMVADVTHADWMKLSEAEKIARLTAYLSHGKE